MSHLSGTKQWFDETLVAIELLPDGKKYRVLELPARSTDRVISRRKFTRIEQAEDYITTQYSSALTVQPEDITEEIERRRETPHKSGIRTRINDDLEVAVSAERAVTFVHGTYTFELNEDDAYKIVTTLQSTLFPDVPY